MQTIVCFLRGINVSGHRPLKMATLKDMLTNMGFEDIQTYVQSGNVVLKSKCESISQLQKDISVQIEKTFGYDDIPVMCVPAEELKKIVEQNPFAKDEDKDASFFHITFLDGKVYKEGLEALEAKKREGEEIKLENQVVYLYCPKGYGTSKLSNSFIESKLKVTATTRNWKTCNKLLELSNI